MKKIQAQDIVGILFTFIALISLAVVIYFIDSNNKFLKNGKETVGIISRIEKEYDGDDVDNTVYVKYHIYDDEYENRINSYSSDMYEGKKISLIYDINNPNHVKAKFETKIVYIFLILPLIFGIIGLIFVILMIKRNKLMKNLMRLEYYVEANIDLIEVNKYYAVNGIHPYIMHCSYNGNSFKSGNFYEDIKSIIDTNEIKKVPLYVNLSNPKQYVVDLESLKKKYKNG